jgi:hypothetical protein
MGQSTMGNGIVSKGTVKASSCGLMVLSMMENGSMTRLQERVVRSMLMEMLMYDSGFYHRKEIG